MHEVYSISFTWHEVSGHKYINCPCVGGVLIQLKENAGIRFLRPGICLAIAKTYLGVLISQTLWRHIQWMRQQKACMASLVCLITCLYGALHISGLVCFFIELVSTSQRP